MRHRRLGLLGRFTIASVVPLVGLGLVLGHTLSGQIRERAVASATTQTQLIADICLAPLVSAASLADGFAPDARTRLDEEVKMLVDMDVARVSVVGATGAVAYTNDPSVAGTRPAEPELRAALDGAVGSVVRGDFLTVYVPLHEMMPMGEMGETEMGEPVATGGPGEAPPGGHAPSDPIGAFVLAVPHGPIEQAIAGDVRELYLYIGIGLVVLFLALASILRRARRHEYFALHDSLTGLPNRLAFRDRVTAALRAAPMQDGSKVAVMILDLDRFKSVNDTLGHSAGDALLRQISDRLADRLGKRDTVARLGGDEFAVLLPDVSDAAVAGRVAELLHTGFDEPFEVDGIRLEMRPSIGVAIAPDDGVDVEALVRRADVAMYTAKGARSGVSFYSSALDRNSAATLMLVGELRRAIRADELILHYQPQVDPVTRAVVAVEALVRWEHPRHGLLLPQAFVPDAEESPVIHELTAFVLGQGLRQRRAWADAGSDIALAVNVTAWDLLDDAFPSRVHRLLAETRTPPSRLTLEITETVILHDRARAEAVLGTLKELGVRIALDDFGRGYTSLGTVKELPIDEIKIDRSFVADLDAQDAAIIRTTAELGRSLGLVVVAEGVETQRALDAVRDLGCGVVQGYFTGRPSPVASLEGLPEAVEERRIA